jgi:small subunit ribosomal protein S1
MVPRDDDESFAALFERSPGATAHQRRFHAGDRVEVQVVAIGRDAVFADLGAKQEGFFDLVSLAGPDGKLGIVVGARISALVASVDETSGQVRLEPVFVRQAAEEAPFVEPSLGPDVHIPKTRSTPLLLEGARVKGKITGIERYGVFIQITGTQGRAGRGLVPTAETGTPRGSDLKRHFTLGQEVEAKIVNIAEDGRIRLSFGALEADDERGDFQTYAKAEQAKAEKAEPRNLGTLGDLLTKKKPAKR